MSSHLFLFCLVLFLIDRSVNPACTQGEAQEQICSVQGSLGAVTEGAHNKDTVLSLPAPLEPVYCFVPLLKLYIL